MIIENVQEAQGLVKYTVSSKFIIYLLESSIDIYIGITSINVMLQYIVPGATVSLKIRKIC